VNKGKRFKALATGDKAVVALETEVDTMTEEQSQQEPELYSQEEYVEQARRALASFAESIRELAEANKSLLEGREQFHSFHAHGSLSTIPFILLFLYDLECTVDVDDGTRLHFKGFAQAPKSDPSGEGFPGTELGQFIGAGSFSVPPSELVGDGDFSVSMTERPQPPASMRIDWYAGRPPGYKLVGTYLGDSPTPSVRPPFHGRGTWTDITDRN